MRRRLDVRFALGFALVAALTFTVPALLASADPALAVATARVTISGTSNIHPYTASTTTVRLTGVQLGAITGDIWEEALKPGVLQRFEIAIPAATLTSPKDGVDKNMHKALKVPEHPDITFRLLRVEPAAAAGALKAIGMLRIAGVEREIALDVQTERQAATLRVTGEAQILMTDYGIKPPTALMGMLKTNPKVTVTFETALAVPLS